MQLSAEILPEDYRNFHLAFSGRYRLSSRVSFLVLLVVGPLAAFMGLQFLFHLAMILGDGEGGMLLGNTFLLVAVVIGLLSAPVALAYLIDLRPLLASLMRSSRSEVDPAVLKAGVNVGPSHYAFGPDGVTVTMDLHEETYDWSAFTRLAETEALFCLMLGKDRALLFPKRSFEDETRLDDFRQHVQDKVTVTQ